jgi:uncharacterized protein (DUF362 family)
MLTWQKLALLFLIGAPLASVGDAFHVRTGTTFYPPEAHAWSFQGVPFWIPILFGVAAALFGVVYDRAKAILGAGHFKQRAKLEHVMVAGLVYLVLHVISGYICRSGFPATDIVLALPVVLIWYFVDRSSGGALVCLLGGLIGVSAEILLVHQGIFTFSDKSFKIFGVATWLPWIYMAGTLAVSRFVEEGGRPMNLVHHPHAIYSKKPSKVYIVRRKNKRRCLDEAIQSSGFISHLNDKWQGSGKPKDDFMIVIKPNFMCTAFEIDISVYTDVELVEHLIDRIRDQGYSKVKVVESQMVWSIFYNDRTVKRVAEMLGYSGEGYEIVDLTMEPKLYDYGDSTLGRHSVGRTWKEADYRISFAKNKTHFQSYYTGCMKNIYGCLPKRDKLKNYHVGRREFHTSTIAILEEFPVHFCFIDAYFSGDGLAGLIRDNNPNETNTIICGENCLAVDWVQGEKMRLDPVKNPIVSRASERWGKPEIQRIGPMDKYDPWKNIYPGVSAIANVIEEYYGVAKLFCFVFAYRMNTQYKLRKCAASAITLPFRFCAKSIDCYGSLMFLGLVLVLVFLSLFGVLKVNL